MSRRAVLGLPTLIQGQSDPLVASGSSPFHSSPEDVLKPDTRSSTLTAKEKATFDRILKDQDQNNARLAKEAAEETLEAEAANANDPYEDLNSIFDAAVRELHNQEKQQAQAMEKSRELYKITPFQRALDMPSMEARPSRMMEGTELFHKGFARPLEFVEGQLVQQPIGDVEEAGDRLQTACVEHRALIQGMLDKTTTDLEIWQVLETEVFSMAKLLHLQIKHEEKFTKATKKAKAKASREEQSSLKPPTKASEQAFASLLTSESKALTTNTLLAILQANYAHYNLYALRLWRRRHHPNTPYSLSLLPHIKSLGSISYVLGASPGLYNEVLFVKWDKYSDLRGVADLLQEMINQGVEANDLTIKFLQILDRTRAKDLVGGRGNALKQWWRLRSVKEDWSRIMEMYVQLKMEVHERALAAKRSEINGLGEAEDDELLDLGRERSGEEGRRVRIKKIVSVKWEDKEEDERVRQPGGRLDSIIRRQYSYI
ncbi:MAG: hypothetical protein Q9164_002353 [Protoblastenia rupestris]